MSVGFQRFGGEHLHYIVVSQSVIVDVVLCWRKHGDSVDKHLLCGQIQRAARTYLELKNFNILCHSNCSRGPFAPATVTPAA